MRGRKHSRRIYRNTIRSHTGGNTSGGETIEYRLILSLNQILEVDPMRFIFKFIGSVGTSLGTTAALAMPQEYKTSETKTDTRLRQKFFVENLFDRFFASVLFQQK